LLLLAIPVLYPFYLLVMSSFKTSAEIYMPLSLPSTLYLENFLVVFQKVNFLLILGNTVIICVSTLILLVFVSSLGGYRISRRNSRFLNFILVLFLIGMIIPLQVNMVPTYKLAIYLHLLDTRTLLVLIYAAGAIPFATMIYAGFTKSIPRELEEAARMDGCGQLRLFWSIIFPLLLPATGTIIATTIFWFWNDFQGPLIYLDSASKQTLISQLYRFKIAQNATQWGPIFALCTLSTLPLILLFLFTQKYMLRGLTAGALKG